MIVCFILLQALFAEEGSAMMSSSSSSSSSSSCGGPKMTEILSMGTSNLNITELTGTWKMCDHVEVDSFELIEPEEIVNEKDDAFLKTYDKKHPIFKWTNTEAKITGRAYVRRDSVKFKKSEYFIEIKLFLNLSN